MFSQSIRKWAARFALSLTLATAVGAATPSTASAQYIDVEAGGMVLFGAISAGWSIADSISYGLDSPFAIGWAVSDFIVGSAALPWGVAVLSTGEQREFSRQVLGAVCLASGLYNIAHGIWSIVEGRRPPQDQVRLRLSPLASGLMLSAHGTF